MRQSITIRLARRSSPIKAWTSEKSIRLSQWLRADSPTFTALCGEKFTRKEVLFIHLYAVAIIAACVVVSWLKGGTL
jgi:hypothetical protein